MRQQQHAGDEFLRGPWLDCGQHQDLIDISRNAFLLIRIGAFQITAARQDFLDNAAAGSGDGKLHAIATHRNMLPAARHAIERFAARRFYFETPSEHGNDGAEIGTQRLSRASAATAQMNEFVVSSLIAGDLPDFLGQRID